MRRSWSVGRAFGNRCFDHGIRCLARALALGAAGIDASTAITARTRVPFNGSRDCSRLGAREHYLPAQLSLPSADFSLCRCNFHLSLGVDRCCGFDGRSAKLD
jgi:hypothetical protein